MKPAFDIDLLIDDMAVHLRRMLDAAEIREPAVVGIRTGGVWIAERLRTMLQIHEPLGELNIAFYRDGLGLPVDATGTVSLGDARLCVADIGPVARSPDWRGPGLRYITLQVMDARAALGQALANGAEGADSLRDLGELVRFAFIRDPDGNFIELSERTTFTGRPLCP